MIYKPLLIVDYRSKLTKQLEGDNKKGESTFKSEYTMNL